MTKEDFIYLNGTVMEMLANRMCRVKLEDERIILCYLKSNINKRVLKLMMGDEVSVEMSLYDQNRGRVVGRANKDSLSKK